MSESTAPAAPTVSAREESPAPPTRRRVLGLAIGTGAAGFLVSGGDDGDDTGSASTASSAEESSPAESTPEETSGGGEALVATADVPVGGGVVLEAQKIVVTQPEAGTFKGFTAVCTHQQCTVASVKDGTISCPCHGSAFSAADGTVTNGPATQPLAEVPVSVEGDEVVTA